jgi:hypothetical protein
MGLGRARGLVVRLLAAFLCSVLAACTSGADGPATPAKDPDPPQIGFWANKTAEEAKLPGPLEVSPAHESRGSPGWSPGPWVVCLRSAAPDHPQRYAMFFRDNLRVDYRLALGIDRCGEETFGPLPK